MHHPIPHHVRRGDAVAVFIMTHISGLPPLVSVATIMDLSIDMTP